MGLVQERVERVRGRIEAACRRAGRSPSEVTLIAVSKGFGPAAVRAAVAAGVAHIGENRVQEAQQKRADLGPTPGVTWHMVGHLQTNKVRAALATFDVIHSLDSLRLAEAIASRATRRVPVFIEVNVAGEATKGGFPLERLAETVETIRQMPDLEVLGLMTVAPLSRRAEDARPVFRALRQRAESLGLAGLSMGMTDDFEVAIEEGATHVRIGRAVFGERA